MKKVIRIFLCVFVFLNLCMSFAQFAHSASWSIDSSHTSVAFKIRHLGVSWVRGEFRSFNGQVEYDPKKISKTKVSVSIDAKSVDTRNERRDAHLRNSDFFDVEKHPKIEFESTKIIISFFLFILFSIKRGISRTINFLCLFFLIKLFMRFLICG